MGEKSHVSRLQLRKPRKKQLRFRIPFTRGRREKHLYFSHGLVAWKHGLLRTHATRHGNHDHSLQSLHQNSFRYQPTQFGLRQLSVRSTHRYQRKLHDSGRCKGKIDEAVGDIISSSAKWIVPNDVALLSIFAVTPIDRFHLDPIRTIVPYLNDSVTNVVCCPQK